VLTLSAYRGCTGIDRAAPLIPLLCRCFVRCYLADIALLWIRPNPQKIH